MYQKLTCQVGWIFVAGLMALPPAGGQEAAQAVDPVSIVRLSPDSPGTLVPGEDVHISFIYRIRSRSKFRIFIRPMAGQQIASGYAASGSPLFESGSGRGRASFTLNQAGRVDRLRIIVSEEGTDEHLHRSYVDVDYRFGVPLQQVHVLQPKPQPQVIAQQEHQQPLAKMKLQLSDKALAQLGTYQPPYWRPLPETPEPEPPEDGIPQCFQIDIEPKRCEEIAGRRLTADGVIILDCADGSTWRTTPEGDIYTAPDGRSCRHLVMALRMGTALPPAEPPPGVSAAQWAQQLNLWLDQSVANNLLFRIQLLLGDEHFSNFEQLEADATNNLYQRIDYRLAFLERLREGE